MSVHSAGYQSFGGVAAQSASQTNTQGSQGAQPGAAASPPNKAELKAITAAHTFLSAPTSDNRDAAHLAIAKSAYKNGNAANIGAEFSRLGITFNHLDGNDAHKLDPAEIRQKIGEVATQQAQKQASQAANQAIGQSFQNYMQSYAGGDQAEISKALDHLDNAISQAGKSMADMRSIINNNNMSANDRDGYSRVLDHLEARKETVAQQKITDNQAAFKPAVDFINAKQVLIDEAREQLNEELRGMDIEPNLFHAQIQLRTEIQNIQTQLDNPSTNLADKPNLEARKTDLEQQQAIGQTLIDAAKAKNGIADEDLTDIAQEFEDLDNNPDAYIQDAFNEGLAQVLADNHIDADEFNAKINDPAEMGAQAHNIDATKLQPQVDKIAADAKNQTKLDAAQAKNQADLTTARQTWSSMSSGDKKLLSKAFEKAITDPNSKNMAALAKLMDKHSLTPGQLGQMMKANNSNPAITDAAIDTLTQETDPQDANATPTALENAVQANVDSKKDALLKKKGHQDIHDIAKELAKPNLAPADRKKLHEELGKLLAKNGVKTADLPDLLGKMGLSPAEVTAATKPNDLQAIDLSRAVAKQDIQANRHKMLLCIAGAVTCIAIAVFSVALLAVGVGVCIANPLAMPLGIALIGAGVAGIVASLSVGGVLFLHYQESQSKKAQNAAQAPPQTSPRPTPTQPTPPTAAASTPQGPSATTQTNAANQATTTSGSLQDQIDQAQAKIDEIRTRGVAAEARIRAANQNPQDQTEINQAIAEEAAIRNEWIAANQFLADLQSRATTQAASNTAGNNPASVTIDPAKLAQLPQADREEIEDLQKEIQEREAEIKDANNNTTDDGSARAVAQLIAYQIQTQQQLNNLKLKHGL